jgi:hypothetical protein
LDEAEIEFQAEVITMKPCMIFFALVFATILLFGCGESKTDLSTTPTAILTPNQGGMPLSNPGAPQDQVQAAATPPCIPAFHDGDTVFFTVTNNNAQGVAERGNLEEVAIPLYAFGDPPNQLQPDVLSAVPGAPGYKPWWEVIQVTILDGRDVSTNPFTSEEEILAAEALGQVALVDTEFVFLCQVLPSCN